MKVITEKSLLEMVANLIKSERLEEAALIQRLIDEELEEIDTLTVSKLRSMCDAPKNGKFLVVLNTEDAFHECSFLSDGRVKIGTVAIRIEYCIGWIPCAIYKPELTGDGG